MARGKKRPPPMAGATRKLYMMSSGGHNLDGSRKAYQSRHHTAADSSRFRNMMSREASQFTLLPNTHLHRGRIQHYDEDGFIPGLEDELDDAAYDYDEGTGAQIIQALRLRKRRRVKDAARQRLAENWGKIEPWLASYSLGRDYEVPRCECSGVERVEVRVISLVGKGNYWREIYHTIDIMLITSTGFIAGYRKAIVGYCICGRRCAQLIKHGLFPTTPIKPRTLFSVELLRLLHLQSMRGACSKYAWAEGLRDMLETSINEVIASFHTPVYLFLITEMLTS